MSALKNLFILTVAISLLFSIEGFLFDGVPKNSAPTAHAQGGNLSGPVLNTSAVSANPAQGFDYPVTILNCPANAYLMCNITANAPAGPLNQRIRCPGPTSGQACSRTGTNAVSCRVRFTTTGTWSIQANCGASGPDNGGRYSPTSRSFNISSVNPAPSNPPITAPVPSDDPSTTIPPENPDPGDSETPSSTPTPTPTPFICLLCPEGYPRYNKLLGQCCTSATCDGPGDSRADPDEVECTEGQTCNIAGRGCAAIPDPGKPPCYDEAGNPITDASICPQVALGDQSTGIFLPTTAADFIRTLLGLLLSVAGMVAVALIVRSGYQYMTSRGNPDAVQEARDRLTSAIVGLLFIIFSLVILQVIGVDILQLPGFGN